MHRSVKDLLKAGRKEGKRLLGSRGRWLRLVACAILAMFLVMLPFAVALNVARLIGVTNNFFIDEVLPFLLMIPTLVLVSAPLTARLVRRIVSVVQDNRSVTKKANYGRDLVVGLLTLVWILLPIVAILLAWGIPMMMMDTDLLWQFLKAPSLGDIIGLLLPLAIAIVATVLTVLLVFPYLLLTKQMFFVPYYAAEGATLGEAFLCARRRMRMWRGLSVGFLWHFFDLLVLSVLSVGVLLVFYTLPLMWATYVSIAANSQTTNEGSLVRSNE